MLKLVKNFSNFNDSFTVLATTPTGFEKIAADEIQEKLSVSNYEIIMGKIFFQTSKKSFDKFHQLKSVDNLYLVVKYIPDYVYNENKEKALDDLLKLPSTLPWSDVVDFWRVNQLYCKKKGQRFKKEISEHNNLHEVSKRIKLEEENIELGKSDDISFRVSATRVGKKQSIISPEAERTFGGALNDYTKWKVDLSNYNLEVLLNLGVNSLMILVAMTHSSLHRRNITHFGVTTLRGTIAYNMARLCQIKPGDVVLDPMCGTGSISIEAAREWQTSFNLASDNAYPALQRANSNVKFLNEHKLNCPVEVMQLNATRLPLKSSSVDVVVTDMPFGKRMGSKQDNRKLYPAALSELARVTRPLTGRGCFLTRDKNCMNRSLLKLNSFWKTKQSFFINIGGLTAMVYILQRTAEDFKVPSCNDENKS